MAIPVYCPANFDLVKLEKIINIERPLKYVGDFK